MKKIFYFCIISMLAGIFFPSQKPAEAMTLSAETAIVMDVQSGAILYQKDMDKQEYPASITKVMTAMLAIENSSLDEVVTFSSKALELETNASNIGTVAGEKLTMEECLYAILLMSANEACNGVAEHIAGSTEKYVKMMNQRAKELGCTGTHFANTNGLWLKNHYTTAHDMALIARAAYKNPTFAKITGTKRYYIPKTNKNKEGHYLHNHHQMLLAGTYPQYVYEYCVGGKTGFTTKCRYTLVTYAKKNGMTLVSVVMRADAPWERNNEYSDTTKLLNMCFEKYKRVPIQNDATKEVSSQYLFAKFSPFYNAATSSLTIDEDAGVLLPKGVELNQTEKKVEFFGNSLPTQDGKHVIGHISYTYQGKELGGSDIFYKKPEKSMLNDSIDMSDWFTDAVETANKKPFAWKKFFLIVILVLVVGFLIFYVVQKVHSEREQRARKNRYKKTIKNTKKNEKKLLK